MTELEQIERDIVAVRDGIQVAMRAPHVRGPCGAFEARRRASLSLHLRYLAELLTKREDLRASTRN